MGKRSRRRNAQTAAVLPEKPGRLLTLFTGIEPWIPWAVAGIFLVVMTYLAFRYHTVGGTGVEVDFYAELYPQAEKLLTGGFSPLNYSAKGPVYSFFLAGTYLVLHEFFQAGVLLNLLCSAGFLVTFYFLVRRVFNPATAVITLFAVLCNPIFLGYTYRAGSDTLFLLLSTLSLFFLFRDGGRRDIVLSAVFGLLAFLTRYNGVFIPAGAAVYFAFSDGTPRERLRRAGLWLGVFIAAGLPWFIANWLATGSPVKNDNYRNVALEFYALGKGAGYEDWSDALPRQFTGIGDIFLYNPLYFIGHTLRNMGSHFLQDMKMLLTWKLGMFSIFGLAVLAFVRPVKTRLLYFTFGAIYFVILALVFYNMRFSLFLLTMYLPLSIWPLTLPVAPRYLRWPFRGMLVLLVAMTALTGIRGAFAVNEDIRLSYTFLRDIGEHLGTLEPDKSQKLMSRLPHVAYYSGLTPVMFPEKPATVEELVAYCRENGIRYILYTQAEAQVRPAFRDEFFDIEKEKPGLKLLFFTDNGIVYRME